MGKKLLIVTTLIAVVEVCHFGEDDVNTPCQCDCFPSWECWLGRVERRRVLHVGAAGHRMNAEGGRRWWVGRYHHMLEK